MGLKEIDLIVREARAFACYQTVLDILSPDTSVRDAASVGDLLDFLIEEMKAARSELHALRESRIEHAKQQGREISDLPACSGFPQI